MCVLIDPSTVSKLVKHTGFGNAAGLLMSRGLLGGASSEGAGYYSSDSDNSDTEEYQQARDKCVVSYCVHSTLH